MLCRQFLESVYKCLRLCDLCKELAFGAPAQKGEVAIFIQLVRAQPVVPPVPGEYTASLTRSKWAARKAIRAGLAFGGRIQPHFFAPEDRQNKREIKKVGRDVTDEQRSRRPIFIATLWAAASWLFFCVARSLRIKFRYARRYCQSGSDRLEKQPTDPAAAGRKACYFGDRTLANVDFSAK